MRTAIAPLGHIPGIVRSSVVVSLVLGWALFLQSAQPAHAADLEVSSPGMCSGSTSPFTCRFATTLYVENNNANGLYWYPITITASSGLMISEIFINTTYTRDGSNPEDCLFAWGGEPTVSAVVDPYLCVTEPQTGGGHGESGVKNVEIDVTFISSRAEPPPTCFSVDDEMNRRLRTRVHAAVQMYGSGNPVTILYCDPSFAIPSPVIATTTTVTFGTGPFIYSGSAFTATATVSPPEAGTPTIAYTGDCVNVGTTCTATATFAATSTHAGSVSEPANITITYAICAPAKGDDDDRDDHGSDQVKGHEAGSTIPVKVRICDAAGRNIGSHTLQVQAVSISPSGTLASAGKSNPDNLFRLDGRTYRFNLSTKGLAPGAHTLDYTVGNDPTTYHYDFTIRAEKSKD